MNTKEAEGAEYLVLGNLLIQEILSFKAYEKNSGFDLIAVNPSSKKSTTIQVKSRSATDHDSSFLIKNFDNDFVVVAFLNRGYRYSRQATDEDSGVRAPEFFILPTKLIITLQNQNAFGKISIKKIPNYEKFKDNWELIRKAIK